jgi:ADP-ribose pyrophosphatase
MTIKPWKVLETTYICDNVRIDTCEISNGLVIKPLVREFIPWVNVVALTPAHEIVLIRQYRHGMGQVIWEIPAGMAHEANETLLDAAKRELLEETGYASEKFFEIGKVSADPASYTNLTYSFLALDVEKVSNQNLDDTEEIDVFLLPLEEAIQMAQRGELPQALQVSALFFALLYLGRIA